MIEIQLHKILNVSLCWDILRETRWKDGVACPHCGSSSVVKNGKNIAHPDNQHYRCKDCNKYFSLSYFDTNRLCHKPLYLVFSINKPKLWTRVVGLEMAVNQRFILYELLNSHF